MRACNHQTFAIDNGRLTKLHLRFRFLYDWLCQVHSADGNRRRKHLKCDMADCSISFSLIFLSIITPPPVPSVPSSIPELPSSPLPFVHPLPFPFPADLGSIWVSSAAICWNCKHSQLSQLTFWRHKSVCYKILTKWLEDKIFDYVLTSSNAVVCIHWDKICVNRWTKKCNTWRKVGGQRKGVTGQQAYASRAYIQR